MTDGNGMRGAVSVGSVLARAFALIAAAPVPVIGLSMLVGALPRVALTAAAERLGVSLAGGADVAVVVAGYAAGALLGLVLSAFVQGAIARAAVAQAERGRAGIAASLGAALGVLPALAMLATLSGLGIALGLVVLLVPGIWIAVRWSVAAPALVAERLGAFAALGRSAALVRGSWPTVFALLALLLVVSWFADGIVAGVALMLGRHGALMRGVRPSLGWSLVDLAYETGKIAVWASAHAALYLELREAREGPVATRLAAIFA